MKAHRKVLPRLGNASETRSPARPASKDKVAGAELDDDELAMVIGGVRPREKRDPISNINLSNVTSKGNA